MLEGIGCPDAAKLAGYAHDDLVPEDSTVVETHLAACPACLKRFLDLPRQTQLPDIPNCQVVKEIGRGRFGVVYKAWWLADVPRIVALKVLSCAGNMEENRFEREIAVLSRIDSPWIVKCLHSGVAGGARYFVMDLIEGVHLDDYLDSATEGLDERLIVFQRVCRAVADAHDAGVVHRDLKPSNILIDAEGFPHIVDFGICTVDHDDWSSWDRHTITRPGDVIGTLKYMSPEQAWGRRVASPIDKPSDIWSLGVLLYGIVTDGGYPYPLNSTPDKPAHELLLERIRKELPRLPRLDSLPRGRDLEILLERCLTWEPDRRIASAGRLANDLERHCRGQRIQTRPPGTVYRARRLAVAAAARSRWSFQAAFVAALAVVLWFAAFPFVVGWEVSGLDYRVPTDSAASLTAPGRARQGTVVVGIFDETIEPVRAFAKKERIEGVTAAVPTWRAVHGRLMERLALAQPRSLVWDYYFRTPRAGDQQFAAGVKSLEQAGVPVVLAVRNYRPDGSPDLSPGVVQPLGRRLRHGAIVARDMVMRPGEFVLGIRRGEDTALPGLALTTLAAVIHPEARLELEWPQRTVVELLYELEPGTYLRARDGLPFSKVFHAGSRQDKVLGDDLLVCSTFALERPEQWERRTVRYEKLLTCPDDELRALVNDKLIIVGDLRTAASGIVPDRHPVKYGATIVKDVPGCYLLADAVAGLLEGRYLKSAFPLPPATFGSMVLVAVVGCLVPLKLAANRMLQHPSRRRLLWIVTFGLASVSFLVMVLTKNRATVHLGMVGFSLLMPMAGSFWVEFVRNRHRLLDRTRLAIEDRALPADGTITITSLPRRSPPETG